MRVTLADVSKSFGQVEVVKGLNLEVADREFLVLLGPSGCGKTTALRRVAGLETVSAGRIHIGDNDVTNVLPKYRDIAMVFQSYALYPHMTVAENIGYPLKLRGVPRPERDTLIRQAATKVHLEQLLARYPRQLSGGQRQRVALARAIVRRPALFLMDEPLSNLDAKLRVTMRGELRRFHLDLNATTIYVTHDQLEAMTMADRIAVMDHGVLQQVGTPLEVYNDPANLFVARFIGAPGMNLITGRPVETARGIAIDLGPLGLSPALPDHLAAVVRRSAGDVCYGFRPEQVELGDGRDALALPVSLVERIGARNIVHLGDPLQGVRAVFDHDIAIEAGKLAHIVPQANSIRLFDSASGRALVAGGLNG
jgi:multiple sugar transport system ATP-binding protein